jgi:hypothetical protein
MEWECFEDKSNKGDWRVEAIDFDHEGDIYITIFSGQNHNSVLRNTLR